MASHRNKFEDRVAAALPQGLTYENIKLPYVLNCNYIPDFIDAANKVIYEAKGRFTAIDRRKQKAIKKQHPDWTVVMIFQNPNQKISKGSKTSYADWCDKNCIRWMTV
ncbi:endodeoxyribonuclease [Agrobacterium tumefaciens]|nr:endodeoxyribonuclease [Agrobacterium tumefaciens]